MGDTLDGTELGGAVPTGPAPARPVGPELAAPVAEGGGAVEVDGIVDGDMDDHARGVAAAADTAGMLEVGLPLGEHAVKASASPSTAPAANFPKK